MASKTLELQDDERFALMKVSALFIELLFRGVFLCSVPASLLSSAALWSLAAMTWLKYAPNELLAAAAAAAVFVVVQI